MLKIKKYESKGAKKQKFAYIKVYNKEMQCAKNKQSWGKMGKTRTLRQMMAYIYIYEEL